MADPGAGDRRSAARTRPGRLPGRRQLREAAAQLRAATRASAVRGALDGAYVTWTLRRRGVRPLLARETRTFRPEPERARSVAAAIDAGMGLLPVAPTCLRRSVTLLRELRRLGLAADLHIGVRTIGERLEAHAWVQVDDVVVNDDVATIATYTRLAGGELERVLPMLR